LECISRGENVGKTIHTIGCCGLDCVLCPRYYTDGASRCPGCCGANFENKHPSCSFITCCVGRHGLEVCADCSEFPCGKFDRETGERDSFVTHRKVIANQKLIQQIGIDAFLGQQAKRTAFLQTALDHYDDGRSKNFYCLAAALLSVESLDEAVRMAGEERQWQPELNNNIKDRVKMMKDLLTRFAGIEEQELKLRK